MLFPIRRRDTRARFPSLFIVDVVLRTFRFPTHVVAPLLPYGERYPHYLLRIQYPYDDSPLRFTVRYRVLRLHF